MITITINNNTNTDNKPQSSQILKSVMFIGCECLWKMLKTELVSLLKVTSHLCPYRRSGCQWIKIKAEASRRTSLGPAQMSRCDGTFCQQKTMYSAKTLLETKQKIIPTTRSGGCVIVAAWAHQFVWKAETMLAVLRTRASFVAEHLKLQPSGVRLTLD